MPYRRARPPRRARSRTGLLHSSRDRCAALLSAMHPPALSPARSGRRDRGRRRDRRGRCLRHACRCLSANTKNSLRTFTLRHAARSAVSRLGRSDTSPSKTLSKLSKVTFRGSPSRASRMARSGDDALGSQPWRVDHEAGMRVPFTQGVPWWQARGRAKVFPSLRYAQTLGDAVYAWDSIGMNGRH